MKELRNFVDRGNTYHKMLKEGWHRARIKVDGVGTTIFDLGFNSTYLKINYAVHQPVYFRTQGYISALNKFGAANYSSIVFRRL